MPLMKQMLFIIASFLLVALGQPMWCSICGLAAAVFGYALFWRALWGFFSLKHRFWLAAVWFTSVQLFQLAWMISHPYGYIFAVWAFFAFLLGLQFGLFSFLVRPVYIASLWKIVALASLWTILEWLRLFFMSGFTWNPAGLALSGNEYSIQTAAIWGVYGLSFWVMLTNLLFLRAWMIKGGMKPIALCVIVALFPYLFGYFHILYHEKIQQQENQPQVSLSALLVQPAFPIEEMLPFQNIHEAIAQVEGEWKKILSILAQHKGKEIDLILFPECVVPYGTYTPLFPFTVVKNAFKEILGKDSLKFLPPPVEPLGQTVPLASGPVIMVSNAYWSQAIAEVFKAGVVMGLEDVDEIAPNERQATISAHYFQPGQTEAQRYDKRILLPMAEYIPFDFCKNLAAGYGVMGSFTPGKEAQIFDCKSIPFGVSICYEETFGHLMRENRQKGASFLLNLTSDIWYPNSALPSAHFEHARLRTVEQGVPLLRSCNNGITGVIDSFGRTIAVLGETYAEQQQTSGALHAIVPIKIYPTLYSRYGDSLIMAFSFFMTLCFAFSFLKKY